MSLGESRGNFGEPRMVGWTDSTGPSYEVPLLPSKCQLPDSQFRGIVAETWRQVAYASLERSGNRNPYFSTRQQIDLAENTPP